ncbi:MAG: pirin family protein [Pusillimonas sp.]
MIEIRNAQDRGHANHGWLNSYHTFSFAEYFDPAHMGWRALRVINDDTVAPKGGFATHGHRDMEIISYVLDGELAHQDSMGSSATIRPGDVQVMSAGAGIRHSEFNASAEHPVHFLQIWITPDRTGTAPRYQEKFFADHEKRGQLRLVVSPDGANGSLQILQDARLYAGLLDGSETVVQAVPEGRHGYVHVARGTLQINGTALGAGDGARISSEQQLTFSNGQNAEFLYFDLL